MGCSPFHAREMCRECAPELFDEMWSVARLLELSNGADHNVIVDPFDVDLVGPIELGRGRRRELRRRGFGLFLLDSDGGDPGRAHEARRLMRSLGFLDGSIRVVALEDSVWGRGMRHGPRAFGHRDAELRQRKRLASSVVGHVCGGGGGSGRRHDRGPRLMRDSAGGWRVSEVVEIAAEGMRLVLAVLMLVVVLGTRECWLQPAKEAAIG
nr:hypothetical protein CFP56_21600 [Quercus suber]